MTSKRKMQAQIDALTKRLTYLENMHARLEKVSEYPLGYTPLAERQYIYEGKIGRYNGRDLTRNEVREVIDCPHPQTREHTATTSKLDHVTLQELARFVIDRAPIIRKCHKSASYEIEVAPGTITKSIETDLGNIKITEGTD